MNNINTIYKIPIYSRRKNIWLISFLAVFLSLTGFILSLTNSSIKAPLRPGLDFTGGTQIKLERQCNAETCTTINTTSITDRLSEILDSSGFQNTSITTSNTKIQLLDNSKSLVIRLPFLTSSQSKLVLDSMASEVGPLEAGGASIDTIGPSLGARLLKSSLISLLVAFSCIAIYISIRFDRKYAFLALLALAHDLIIVCGIFAWLGLMYQVEVDSLFTVALLTIAGYSVNDTVVIFDRIRELNKFDDLTSVERIDIAVSSSLTRTLYTSSSTLLPLIALIFFGGSSLKLFSIALAIGVVVGSWSSIALAPSLLSLNIKSKNNIVKVKV